MNTLELSKICYRQFIDDKPPRIPPGQSRFITGMPYIDSHLYQLEKKYGLKINLVHTTDPNGRLAYEIKDYQILDEKKFTIFLLKWS